MTATRTTRIALTFAALALAALALPACEKKEPTPGERLDAALEGAKEAGEEMQKGAKKAAEDANEKLKDATQKK